MTLIRLSTPSGLAVPLIAVKEALPVDHSDDDTVLRRLIRQETRRYEDFTGRVMLPTDFEYRVDNWKEPIVLPAAPIRSITAVVYLDEDHAEQDIDASDWYQVDTMDAGAELRFTDAFDSPTLSDRELPVRIRFSAGYDDEEEPTSGNDAERDPVDQDQGVIMMMVGWLYDKGEPMSDEMLRRMAGNRRIFR